MQQPGLSPYPLLPAKAKLPWAHILPEVEERSSDPAQGFGHPPLLIGLRGAPGWGDGQSIESGTQQGLPRQPVHLHREADPRADRKPNQEVPPLWLPGPGGPGSQDEAENLASRYAPWVSLPAEPGQIPNCRQNLRSMPAGAQSICLCSLLVEQDKHPLILQLPTVTRQNSLGQSHLEFRCLHAPYCQPYSFPCFRISAESHREVAPFDNPSPLNNPQPSPTSSD